MQSYVALPDQPGGPWLDTSLGVNSLLDLHLYQKIYLKILIYDINTIWFNKHILAVYPWYFYYLRIDQTISINKI